MRFSTKELTDLGVAWVALGVAFAFFAVSASGRSLLVGGLSFLTSGTFVGLLAVSMATAGVGFLLHELAHKVVAQRFGQVAEFRADYGMLALAVGASLAGFIFAAPGAVYHGGHRVTKRENGLIALAGPLTNLALAAVFLPLFLFGSGIVELAGHFGLWVNLVLAGFNMLPFGPIDGRKVRDWSMAVFLPAAVVCIGLGLVAFLFLGTGF